MKILIPMEIPDGTNSIELECTVTNEDEMRISHMHYNEQNINVMKTIWEMWETFKDLAMTFEVAP